MTLEVQKIIDRILLKAREEAEAIIVETRESADKLVENQKKLAYQKAKSETSKILKKGQNDAEAIRRTVISDAKRQVKWSVLSEKEVLIDHVLKEVKNRLDAFSTTDKYISFLEKLIVETGISLGGGRLKILLSKKDLSLSLDFDALSRKIGDKTGVDTELEILDEKIEHRGGCVVMTYDSRIVIDNTFPTLIKRHERDLRLDIAKILFSD